MINYYKFGYEQSSLVFKKRAASSAQLLKIEEQKKGDLIIS